MDKAEKERAIKAGNMAREAMEGDTVLAVGMKIRRRSVALALANVLASFGLLLRSPYVDFPVLAFVVCSYLYSKKFRAWELKNQAYLRRMGFEVKT